jgi:hypothetical protein
MRWLVALLAAANLLVGAWLLLGAAQHSPEAQIIDMQMKAEQVQVIEAESSARARPEQSGPARRGDPVACLEWGPFAGDELAQARAALAGLVPADRLGERRAGATALWAVYLPPFNSRAAAEQRLAEVRQLNVRTGRIVTDDPEWRHAIEFGRHRSEADARAQIKRLQEAGVRNVQLGQRGGDERTLLLLRDPSDALTAKMLDLRARFPASSLGAVECPR